MKKSLTPEKILEHITNNNISYNEAFELLISLIDVSESEYIRARCIEVLNKMDIKSKKIFKKIEYYLLSDEAPLVRAAATKVLISKFPKDSINPLRHTIQNDNSAIVLKTLAYSLDNTDNQNFKTLKQELTANFERIAAIYGIHPEELLLLLNIEFDLDFFNEARSSSVFGIRYGGNKSFAVRDYHVRALYLRDLGKLTDSIGSFKYLEHLDLCNNNISKIPKSIGLLTSLKSLWLSNNDIKIIPESIESLKSLVSLKLNHNKIKEIPQSIKNLTMLKYLDLNNNLIREIPDNMESLKFLEQLDLRYNRIEKIPESIGYLSSLEELWLSHNKIQRISENLKDLKKLKYLDLRNNNILDPISIEVLKKKMNIRILY